MILALGKNGQLSQEFSNIFLEKITYLSSSQLDLRDSKKIKLHLGRYKPKIIINFTAYNFVDQAESDRDNVSINALAMKEIAEFCNLSDITLIHVSTDYVFDGKKGNYAETDLANPINAYGKAKLEGENFIKEICTKYYIFRTSWLYSLYGNNFLTRVMDLYKKTSEFKGADDLIGSPTSARSLAHAIKHIIDNDKKEYGLYHFANKGAISKYTFLQTIVDNLVLKDAIVPIKVIKAKNKDFKMTAERPYNTSLESSNFEKVFDYAIPKWNEELKIIMDKI